MKKRIGILLMTGVFTLSAYGALPVNMVLSAETSTSENIEAQDTNEEKVAPQEALDIEVAVTEPPVVETEPIVIETDPPVVETEPAVIETEPQITETDPIPTETEGVITEPETEPAQSENSTEAGSEGTSEAESGSESETEEQSESSTDVQKETEQGTEQGTEEILETEKQSETKTEKETEKIDPNAALLYEKLTGESVYVFGSYPPGNITENTNEIYDYLIDKLGLNHAAACGVLANIQCESNFAPTAIGDGGTSYGLCQWHLGRFSQLISWCLANGEDYHTVKGQLGYLFSELSSGYLNVYEYILSVPDTEQGAYDAAYYWCKYFEIPSNLEYNSQMRADLAKSDYYPRELGTDEDEKDEKNEQVETEKKISVPIEKVIEKLPESISDNIGSVMLPEEFVVQESVTKAIKEENTNYKELQKMADEIARQVLEEYRKNKKRKAEESVIHKVTAYDISSLSRLGSELEIPYTIE